MSHADVQPVNNMQHKGTFLFATGINAFDFYMLWLNGAVVEQLSTKQKVVVQLPVPADHLLKTVTPSCSTSYQTTHSPKGLTMWCKLNIICNLQGE